MHFSICMMLVHSEKYISWAYFSFQLVVWSENSWFSSTLILNLAGLTEITKPLKDLLPILVGCFLDFMPFLQSTSQLDLQSYECLQFILQSIDLIAGFLVSGICRSEPDLQILPLFQKHGMIKHDQLISPLILKKLWDVFPLNLLHHLSGKVYLHILRSNVASHSLYNFCRCYTRWNTPGILHHRCP